MKHIWAPWRIHYLKGMSGKDGLGCLFCRVARQRKDTKNLIVYRGPQTFVILNKYPYNNGHILIVPYMHTGSLSQLSSAVLSELMLQAQIFQEILKPLLHPDGWNIGMNIGKGAGAGIDKHIHMHVLPRWNGDTNFLPVLSETKVISQSLEEFYSALSALVQRHKDMIDTRLNV